MKTLFLIMVLLLHTVPILKTEDEFWADDSETSTKSVNEVTDVPEGFKEWVRGNSGRIEVAEGRGTLPYFIKDNRKVVEEVMEEVESSKAEDRARIEANRKEYERLKADPNYKGVEFNPENGGLKATHVEHNFDPDDGYWEMEVVDIGFNNGRKVILESEFSNIIGKRFTEGTWDGLQFELATRETATENNILRGLKHCADKRVTEIAILYFPNGGFNYDKLQVAIRRYRGYARFPERTYVEFKKVICIEFNKIVYEEAF